MIAFPAMLIGPAEKAGIKVPPDANNFMDKEYPHFTVYLNAQLGHPMPHPTAHWDNAKVIAAIPEDKIFTITVQELLAAGFAVGYPLP